MDSQKTTPKAVSQKVKLDELRLGLLANGTIKVGILGKDGNLDDRKSKDISEDFYNIMQTIGALQALMLKRQIEEQAEAQKLPLILPPGIGSPTNED